MKARLLDAIVFWVACLCLNGMLLFFLLSTNEIDSRVAAVQLQSQGHKTRYETML